jgi:hypothetical protein
MIRPTVVTTKMYFYYATCFGHMRIIIRQFQYMNTTVTEGAEWTQFGLHPPPPYYAN